MNGDFYMNPCLSEMTNELWFLKMVDGKPFPMKPQYQSIYPNKQNEFMGPNHGKKGDYYLNLCLSQFTDEL